MEILITWKDISLIIKNAKAIEETLEGTSSIDPDILEIPEAVEKAHEWIQSFNLSPTNKTISCALIAKGIVFKVNEEYLEEFFELYLDIIKQGKDVFIAVTNLMKTVSPQVETFWNKWFTPSPKTE